MFKQHDYKCLGCLQATTKTDRPTLSIDIWTGPFDRRHRIILLRREVYTVLTCHDGRGDLESQQVEREVPWRDEPRHPQGSSAGDVHHGGRLLAGGSLHQTLPGVRELTGGFKKALISFIISNI